jgi:hypothetical protein
MAACGTRAQVTTGWVANDQGVLWGGHDSVKAAVTDTPAGVWEQRAAADTANAAATTSAGVYRDLGLLVVLVHDLALRFCWLQIV